MSSYIQLLQWKEILGFIIFPFFQKGATRRTGRGAPAGRLSLTSAIMGQCLSHAGRRKSDRGKYDSSTLGYCKMLMSIWAFLHQFMQLHARWPNGLNTVYPLIS